MAPPRPPKEVKRDAVRIALTSGLTRHVNILEMNGESYRLDQSRENAVYNNWPTFTPPLTVHAEADTTNRHLKQGMCRTVSRV